jgi:hypothetical protein
MHSFKDASYHQTSCIENSATVGGGGRGRGGKGRRKYEWWGRYGPEAFASPLDPAEICSLIILNGAQTTISRNSIFGKPQDNGIRTRLPGAVAPAPSNYSPVSIWYPMSFPTNKSPSDNVFVRVTERMRNSNRMMEFAGTLKGSKDQTLFRWVPRLLFSFSSASGRSLTIRLKC